MATKNFHTICNFLDSVEFCPLCKVRLSFSIIPKNSKIIAAPLTENKIRLYDESNGTLILDLASKKITSSWCPLTVGTSNIATIQSFCKKYHFYHEADIILQTTSQKTSIKKIIQTKLHFVIYNSNIHFSVNNFIKLKTTNIRITSKDRKTEELFLPLINFDLSSKRKLFKSLNSIQLLK